MAASDASQLSSVSTTLDELVSRVTRAGEERLAVGDEGAAAELFEVERSLRAAKRRLQTALRRLS